MRTTNGTRLLAPATAGLWMMGSAVLVASAGANQALPAVVGGHFLDEGFEDTGTFPPAGWSYVPTAAYPHDWHPTTDPIEIHGGDAAAAVERQSLIDQYEVLFTPPIDLQSASGSGLRLSFWYRTDPFWFHGDDTVFRVHASLDSVDWSPLFRLDDVTETGWSWRNVIVDLSDWADVPGLLRVRFTYYGRDAADLALDDVRIGYLEAPAPPANDTCAGASTEPFTIGPAPGPFQVIGNSFFANHDYTLPLETSCTGHAHDGRDLVWRVQIPTGHLLTVTMTTVGSWDDTLFLVTDCANPVVSCVVGDRGFPDGAEVSWVNVQGDPFFGYLVASGWGSAAGEFDLSGAIEPDVAVTPWTWGRLKASYRADGDR